MPLPWKKKPSRFSRIVADLQSPNNRGRSSLVVETGFPTSLVDLFVKNRDKFKKLFNKNSKNKRCKKGKGCPANEEEDEDDEELLISDPVLLSNSRDLGCNLSDAVLSPRRPPQKNLEERRETFGGFGLVGDDEAKSCHLDDDGNSHGGEKKVLQEEGDCVNVSKGKRAVVLVLLLKVLMLMLVVLACSTKKLAVGITMSAFVLISLEHVAEHVLCFVKPCSNARLVIESWNQRVFPFFKIRSRGMPVPKEVKNCEIWEKELIFRVEDDFLVVDSSDLVGPQIELGSRVEEIQVLELKLDGVAMVEKNQCMEANLDAGTKTKVGGIKEDKSDVVIGEKECSRLAKMRSKMIKKLVPKKLRGRKRGRRKGESEPHSTSEAGSCSGEDKSELLEEEEIVGQQGLKDAGKQLTDILVLEGGGKEKDSGKTKEAVQHDGRGLPGMDKIIPGEEQVERRMDIQRKRNSSLLILFIIILAALACGRILALVLTVASCFMFKIITWHKRCKQVCE